MCIRDSSTCSSEACAFMTISIRDPLFLCPIVYRGRRAAGHEQAARTLARCPCLESNLHRPRFEEKKNDILKLLPPPKQPPKLTARRIGIHTSTAGGVE